MAQKLATTARTGRDNQSKSIGKILHPLTGCSAPEACEQKYCGVTFVSSFADMVVLSGYGTQGERLVAGVVPLSKDKKKVLLIQSTRRGGWVLPKGGWETDEGTAEEAACREAWEEAGIECKIQKDLGKIPDQRPANQLTSHAPKAMFQFYEVSVEKEASQWPEKHKRGRQWMSYTEAREALTPRPELLEALNRSSVVR
jgi:diphosphoinositol-polyphosphate diphosphatase